MNGKFLLDTNIVIAIFNKLDTAGEKLKSAEAVFVPAIVIGELCFGAEKSSKKAANLKKIREFADVCSVLVCTTETSFIYGHIKNQLRIRGTPIPENDLWIAALAKQHNLTLVSRDAHFGLIKGITINKW